MNRWAGQWDCISPMFKFSREVRKVIYTTNAIESFNSGYRRLNRNRSVFPASHALLKALYLTTFELTKKWNMPLRSLSPNAICFGYTLLALFSTLP